MLRKIKKTLEFIHARTELQPEVGIILGSGLGGLVNEIEIEFSLSYEDIPNFPVSTVEGHNGRLIFGKLSGKNIVAMQGRFHYYEGYTMQEITFPVRVMKMLGIRLLILLNASGGVNPEFEVGDMMIITDHINLLPTNPLIGPNDKESGPRFPDMKEAYDTDLIRKAIKIARRHNIKCQTGVFAAVTGPMYETPAEYRFIRNIGADAVGMSTIPEVIVARQMDLPCFAISVITDLGVPGKIVEVSHSHVIAAASQVEPRVTLLIKELLSDM